LGSVGVISVQNVSKLYQLYEKPIDRLLDALPLKKRRASEFWALRDVNFHVNKGEVYGIMGPNGSGKSTLLQIVSGILQPTIGRVLCGGRIAALLELGAGFNPDFTGRENVFLNGEIMGLTRAEMLRAFPKIENFAEIGRFIDRPVKEYSTGMYVRLAFSTAIHVDPEILIVDEALAVGDAIFSARCVQKFEELRERGVTVLLVSHDLGLVKRLATRAAFMLGGKMVAEGSPKDVVNRYVGYVLDRERRVSATDTTTENKIAANSTFRHGDASSRVTDVQLMNGDGEATRAFRQGDVIRIQVTGQFQRPISGPVVGILIRNRIGVDVFGTNTRIEERTLGDFEAGDILEVEFELDCLLSRGEYTLTVAVQHWDGRSHDWLDDVMDFQVVDTKEVAGMLNLNTRVHHRRLAADSQTIGLVKTS
jgi:lipopolysaccharide transport system ATP-binding protein